MRKTLEDLCYGSIVSYERQMNPGSEVKRAAGRVTRYESQLTEQLNESEQSILAKPNLAATRYRQHYNGGQCTCQKKP